MNEERQTYSSATREFISGLNASDKNKPDAIEVRSEGGVDIVTIVKGGEITETRISNGPTNPNQQSPS